MQQGPKPPETLQPGSKLAGHSLTTAGCCVALCTLVLVWHNLLRLSSFSSPPGSCLLQIDGEISVFTAAREHDIGTLSKLLFRCVPLTRNSWNIHPNRGSLCLNAFWFIAFLLLALCPLLLIDLLCLRAVEFIHICLIWGSSSSYRTATNTAQPALPGALTPSPVSYPLLGTLTASD